MNCFQLASTHHLVDIVDKCLDWLTKYFCKTWNSKSFANLPEQLQQKSLESVKHSMVCIITNVVHFLVFLINVFIHIFFRMLKT